MFAYEPGLFVPKTLFAYLFNEELGVVSEIESRYLKDLMRELSTHNIKCDIRFNIEFP